VVTFGNRFFTPSTLGLVFAVFYGAELLGAWAAALVVGDEGRSAQERSRRGYCQFFAATTAGYAIALVMELRHEGGTASRIHGRASVGNVAFGSLAMLLWGFSDSMVQALAYWQMKVWFPRSGEEASRAVGFYKFVTSAGWCIGFAVSPPPRLAPIWQLALSLLCYLVGLFVLEPPTGSDKGGVRTSGDDNDGIRDGVLSRTPDQLAIERH
jgi:hypothetical protein